MSKRDYYRISDIVTRWRKATGEDITYSYVVEDIRQGKLKAKFLCGNKYINITKDNLPIFDLSNIKLSLVPNVEELTFSELQNEAVKNFELKSEQRMTAKLKSVYVAHKDLLSFEQSTFDTPKHDKPLHQKERETISILVRTLADLAAVDIYQQRGPQDLIEKHATTLGLSISKGSIKKHLDMAKELTTPPEKKIN